MVIDIIDARASRLIDISSGNGSHIFRKLELGCHLFNIVINDHSLNQTGNEISTVEVINLCW